MDAFLNFIRDYGALSYTLLFGYCALKSGALPLFAGFVAQTGALDVAWVAAAVFAGGYLGDEARFYAVRRYGANWANSRPRFAKAMQNAKKLLDHYGTAYIFLYRYPKGMRTIGALPVALTAINWSKFTLLNASSAALWTGLLVGAGYLFGEVIKDTVSANWGLFSVALLAVFVLLSYLAWRRVSRIL